MWTLWAACCLALGPSQSISAVVELDWGSSVMIALAMEFHKAVTLPSEPLFVVFSQGSCSTLTLYYKIDMDVWGPLCVRQSAPNISACDARMALLIQLEYHDRDVNGLEDTRQALVRVFLLVEQGATSSMN